MSPVPPTHEPLAPHDPLAGDEEVLDLLGVGIGPFNLSLAALADGVPGLRTAFLEQRAGFHWHPGLLIEGATLQVPFLADLVSLVDPTSPWTFLNYVRSRERLFPFYFAERFHIERAEYDAYCRWVSENLPSCRFGHQVDTVRWDPARRAFEVGFTRLDAAGAVQGGGRCYARHLALGVGTVPTVPEPLRALVADGTVPVWHSADYLDRREELLAAEHLTVVGSGQSGAEVFLDLLRRRPEGREALTWLARTDAFAPMEYSKLGLEQFTPDYTRYFHGLSEPARDRLLPQQWQLHKGVSAETLGEIHDELYRRTLAGGWPDVLLTPGVAVHSAQQVGERIELELTHAQQEAGTRLVTDAVVAATGYAERAVDGLLAPLLPHLVRDGAGRPEVDASQRLVLDREGEIGGSVFVQNAERHTHGVGAPDLGLAAWRSAVILNSLTENGAYPLPARTAFTSFGLDGLAGAGTGTGAGGTVSVARRPRSARTTASTAASTVAPAPSTVSAAAASVADAAATENLLRCWVRETGVVQPADGVLKLVLAGVPVEAPVVHWSAVGWHRFGPALLAGRPMAAPALAALLAVETAADDPAAVADLTGRVSDSVRRVTDFVHERRLAPHDPADTTPFLAAEQALICGHPLHPTPKSREGLTEAELRAYSPELRGSFALHWFAADPSVLSADSALDGRSAQEAVAELAEGIEAPPGTVLVPAHPWQAKDVLTRPAVRALLDAGLLHDLGPGGPAGTGGPAWSPTSSVRTVYRADAPVMLKFSLGLRITNSRRENQRIELERGAAIDRLLTAGLGDALRAAHPGFDIVRDPAWLAVEGPDGEPTGLDVILRDNPFRTGGPTAVCAAGLVSVRPDLDGSSQLAVLVRTLAERTGRSVSATAEEWFARYLDAVVVPVLWLYATYGLGLEAHQQNTLVVLDEDGWPVGGRYRDNQGYYFSPTRSDALYTWAPGVGRDLGTYVDDEVVDERLAYYVGVNNLLGMVGALGSEGLAGERDLLRTAAGVLDKLAAEHGDRLRLATTLRTAPTLRCKANLLTRVRGMDELSGPLEAQSVYIDLINPLKGDHK